MKAVTTKESLIESIHSLLSQIYKCKETPKDLPEDPQWTELSKKVRDVWQDLEELEVMLEDLEETVKNTEASENALEHLGKTLEHLGKTIEHLGKTLEGLGKE
ncbi:MAG: hypothetical protein LBK18_01265 [Prevotellaceae bacterium]|jgi:septal ring factor EnvC (AmiA/AmiB activator)|nr:hypothetical protein [Prevotellaceae bacterium]